jgi:hypothetical protein
MNITETHYSISKRQKKSLNIFWIGFLIYTIFETLSATENIYISPEIYPGAQLLGLIIMFTGAVNLIKFKFDNKYLQLIFVIYFLYSLTIIFRDFQYDYVYLKKLLLDPLFGALPFIAPLIIFFPRNIGVYKKLFYTLLILGSVYIIFVILFYNVLRDGDRLNLLSQGLVEVFSTLSLPIGFLLLTYLYHNDKQNLLGLGKKNIFAICVMMLSLYFLIYRARRGSIFMNLTTMASVGMMYFIHTKKKVLIILMSIVLVLASSVFMSNMKMPAMFNFVLDRGDQDTRSELEEYLNADLSSSDWIFGRGINGKYYFPFNENVNDVTGEGYRDVIETGYLQIILKGGIISLVLLLLILLPAVYLGLFKSKSVLSKAAAVWILLWIIYLKPQIGNTFSMHYLLVWTSVGICYSKNLRNMSDNSIKHYLQIDNELKIR